MRFWLGVAAASLTLTATEVTPMTVTETFVQPVVIETVEPWTFEPLPTDVQEHADCLIAVIDHYELEMTVQNLFIVGDMADLLGGPCGMLP